MSFALRHASRIRPLLFVAVLAAVTLTTLVVSAAATSAQPGNSASAVSNADSPECAPTVVGVGFVPPAPYPARAEGFAGPWFGTADLWTTEPSGPGGGGLSQKLFWWSQHFDVDTERTPAITVTARRLDGAGTAAAEAPAPHGWVTTNAPFMLVGLNLPDYGCWEISAEYKGHVLKYVVEATAP